MLIDFCHHCMGAKIKSDKVSFDGYEVTNLLSKDVTLKNKGFLSDHFVKPPVNITIEFPCNIAIYRIVVDPVIGRQQSCDLKIFTGTKTVSKSWLYGNDENSQVDSEGLLLNNIGFISSAEPCVICFQNSYFRERNIWKIDNLGDLYRFPVRSGLKARNQGSLCNVSHLNICVTRTKNSGSVAIKRLEVWGMPAFNVPFVLQQHLLDVFRKAVHPETEQAKIESNESEETFPSIQIPQEDANFIIENDVQVPEDFIDQITFEIMSVPMILPCGKNIDQSTLERFVNVEASWGRAPSDPFTGVLLAPGHQVIPNVALKARLDQFLVRHSDKLNVARTLGRSESLTAKHEIKSSRLVYETQTDWKTGTDSQENISIIKNLTGSKQKEILDEMSKYKLSQVSKGQQNQCYTLASKCKPATARAKKRKFQDTYDKAVDDRVSGEGQTCVSEKIHAVGSGHKLSKFPSKRSFSSSGNCGAKPLDLSAEKSTTVIGNNSSVQSGKLDDHAFDTDKIPNAVRDKTEILTPLAVEKSSLKHASNLTVSLDTALNDVLSSLPSFTSCNSGKKDSSSQQGACTAAIQCIFCENNLQDDNIVKYRLPCSHYICRKCAHLNISDHCRICNVRFSSEQITRVF